MKKISLLLASIMLVALVLSSCAAGKATVNMTFDPVSGNGTKAITISVPKNDNPGVGNNFGANSYIPDPQALLAKFQGILPSFCTTTLKDNKIDKYFPGTNLSNAAAATAISFSSVTLNWKKAVANEIGTVGGYIISQYSKTTGAADSTYVLAQTIKITGANTLSYVDTTIAPSTTFQYNVAAVVDPSAATPAHIANYDSVVVDPATTQPSTLNATPITSNPAKLGDIGSYDYTIAFNFSGIDDYNSKMQTIITKTYWDNYNTKSKADNLKNGLDWTDITPATLTSVKSGTKTTYTFNEDARVTELFCSYLTSICLADKTGVFVDVLGHSHVYTDAEVIKSDGNYTMKFGDKTQTFDLNAVDAVNISYAYTLAASNTTSVASNSASTQSTQSTTIISNDNTTSTGTHSVPATGDKLNIALFALLSITSLAVIVFTAKKKIASKN